MVQKESSYVEKLVVRALYVLIGGVIVLKLLNAISSIEIRSLDGVGLIGVNGTACTVTYWPSDKKDDCNKG